MPYRQVIQGTTGYYQKTLKDALPSLNTELTAKLATDAPPAFALMIGNPPNVASPMIGLYAESGQNGDMAQNIDKETVFLVIAVLIPKVGENTASEFEMTKQVALDVLKSAVATAAGQAPNVTFGSDGTAWRALRAQWTSWASLWPFTMADGVTMIHRYELRVRVDYQINL